MRITVNNNLLSKILDQFIQFLIILYKQLMPKQFFTFRKEFLVPQYYEATKNNNTNLNLKYQQLCNIFERQFSTFNSSVVKFPRQTNLPLCLTKRKKYLFKKELQAFISQFLDILEQQSYYQIQCLNDLKDNNISQFQIIFKLLQKVKENKVFCSNVHDKTNELFLNYSQAKTNFNTIKKRWENPLLFYQKQVVLQQGRSLRDKISVCNKLMQQILMKKKKAQQKIQDFQPYLNAFRKKLIKNKYQVLQKISKLMNNIKNAYFFLADTIKNCTITKKKQFESALMNQQDDITYLKIFWKQIHDSGYLQHHIQQNKQWQKLINQCITQLDVQLNSFQDIFQQLKLIFNNIRNKFAEEQIKLKELLTQISEIFTFQQFPNILVKQLLNFQDIFYRKINKLVVRFEDIQSKMRIERSNFMKKGQMFLTLVKVNKYHGKSLSQNSKQIRNEEIYNLFNQLTFANLKKTILSFYEDSIFSPSQLQGKYNHYYTKRQTYDSMDVSHSKLIYQCPVDKYTMLKEEIWLWKQWRVEIQINFESYRKFFQQIQKYLQVSISKLDIKQSPLLQKENCILEDHKKQIQGELLLKVNSLQFVSNSLKLTVKLTQISGISIIDSIFKDILSLQTQKGKIQLFKLEKLESFVQALKEVQERLQMGGKKTIDKKPLIELTTQQIQALKDRKELLKADFPNLDNYTLLVQKLITPQRIDEIYQLFYSDKPFSFYGKEEPCFFSYTGKKAGNYDWVAEKYDKSGPSFYTLNKEVNFKNCPKFSTRKITYHHPMKPSHIPFMPKFCSNTDKRKMFWISNQELLYQIQSLTEGIPYADHFLVYLVHKIIKVENGVKIQIYYNIKWIKETIMKSKIQSTIISELTQNMNYFIRQTQKVLRLRSQIQRGQASMPQNQIQYPKDSSSSQPKEDVSKTKLYNKVLIVAFVMLLLYNILNLFIFDSS